VEDERHFILHCTFLDDDRTKLWHSINAACSQSAHHTLRYGQPLIIDAFGWSEDERFALLMGGMLPCIVAAKVERKVRVVIMAALKMWMEKRSEHFPVAARSVWSKNKYVVDLHTALLTPIRAHSIDH